MGVELGELLLVACDDLCLFVKDHETDTGGARIDSAYKVWHLGGRGRGRRAGWEGFRKEGRREGGGGGGAGAGVGCG